MGPFFVPPRCGSALVGITILPFLICVFFILCLGWLLLERVRLGRLVVYME